MTFSRRLRETVQKGHELTDEHISRAHTILKKQFPHIDGLQSPLLAQKDGFKAVQHEAIQIHHVPDRHHWVTSSSIGQQVAVYDSKFSGGPLSTSLTRQLAMIYRAVAVDDDGDDNDDDDDDVLCGHFNLSVEIPYYTQQQKGGTDCGVFAIAFAVLFALGDDVSTVQFDQPRMRQHLVKCFQQEKMIRFP